MATQILACSYNTTAPYGSPNSGFATPSNCDAEDANYAIYDGNVNTGGSESYADCCYLRLTIGYTALPAGAVIDTIRVKALANNLGSVLETGVHLTQTAYYSDRFEFQVEAPEYVLVGAGPTIQTGRGVTWDALVAYAAGRGIPLANLSDYCTYFEAWVRFTNRINPATYPDEAWGIDNVWVEVEYHDSGAGGSEGTDTSFVGVIA